MLMPSGPQEIAAIVVSADGLRLLHTCLPAILAQDPPFARILLVDNASADSTRDYVASLPGVQRIALDANQGFAGGANRGIEHALADSSIGAVALINNDVVLQPGWHRAARSALFSREDCGSCATCLLSESDPRAVDSAGIEWRAPGMADNYLHATPSPPPDQPPYEIAGACAGAALYRRESIERAGLFDETLFAYQEDVDLALRMAALGYVCLLAPAARGIHRGSASNRPFPLGGTWADYYNARNRLVVLAKSFPGEEWRRHGPAILRGQTALLFRSLAERRLGAVSCGQAAGIAPVIRALYGRLRKRNRGKRRRS
jgi:GT2 family glycosyltransferase